MAVVEIKKEQGTEGVRKRIDPVAMMMLIDGQQSKQYKEPENSAVREVVSNCIDAVSEKNKALKILRGEAKPSDFYVRRSDDLAKDSNFFIDYYSLEHLDEGNDIVRVSHKYNSTGMDILSFTDYGVGIGFVKHPDTGKTRLEGVLEIGYSTKRNTNTELGKWGIGAKSPLAIGSESGYLMKTVHNGKKFVIRVFDYTYISLIGKFNSEGKTNPHVVFYEGTEDATNIYYEETSEKNHTEITVETMPSQRTLFINAAKNQLQYFDNIEFSIVDEQNQKSIIPIAVEKLYEGKYFIVPKNSNFTRPHIVLNKVNYGLVNYAAMELQEMSGCLALKIDPSRVEVDRSRESLIWNQVTRNEIVRFHELAVNEAQDVLAKTLDVENYAEWCEVVSAYKTLGRTSSDGVSSHIVALRSFISSSGMADISTLDFVHKQSGYGLKIGMDSWQVQHVRTSDHPNRFITGWTTGTFDEMGISLGYIAGHQVDNATKFQVPLVLRLYEDEPPSISAGEKFSILKYLRETRNNYQIKEYMIVSIHKDSLFVRHMKDAKFKYFDFVSFDVSANAYRINLTTGESEVKDQATLAKEEREARQRERSKYIRQNKIFSCSIYLPKNGFVQSDSYNGESLINRYGDKDILYGRIFTKNYDPNEDDGKYLHVISNVVNTDNDLLLVGTTVSNMPIFPTEDCTYVRAFFSRIKDDKLDLKNISKFLYCIAYSEELMKIYRDLNIFIEPKGGIYKNFHLICSKMESLFKGEIQSIIKYLCGYVKEDESKEKLTRLYMMRRNINGLSTEEIEQLTEYFVKVAKFGRFCYENKTAKRDFLASAYITIMELPEDTPLDSVPSGVTGFDWSPIDQIKELYGIVSPISDLLPTIDDYLLEYYKPFVDEVFAGRKVSFNENS